MSTEKSYETKKRAVDNLARDIEKHSGGKVSYEKAHEKAREIANKQDQKSRERQ